MKEKIQKILLISPPGKITITKEGSRERKLAVPCLGLVSLAASLLRAGFEVGILDVMIEGYENETKWGNQIIYGLSDSEVMKRIADFDPDMVGVSCLFSNRGKETLSLCRLAKKVNPDIHVVLGGQHPSGMPSLVQDDNVDYLIYGEADNSLVQLVETINEGGDLKTVKQIVLEEGEGYWKSPHNDYPNPADLPLPAWDLVNLDKYWQTGLPDYEVRDGSELKFMVLMTSRGCPHECYFCTAPLMSDRQFRKNPLDDVIKEIALYRDKYGVEEIFFWDDNFFVNKKRVKELLRRLAVEFPELKFQVPSGTEVNALDEEMIDLLAQAGFTKLFLAIESFNPEIQESQIDKKVNLERIPEIVKMAAERGIITEGSFMVGFPGESKAQIDHTLEMAPKLGLARISISIVNPLPGTGLYDECQEKNLFYDDFDPHDLRWSVENIRMDEVERGYIAKRRRDVWLDYMADKIDIDQYENQNMNESLDAETPPRLEVISNFIPLSQFGKRRVA